VGAQAADGSHVTAEAEGFNSVSLDPPLVLWTLDRAAAQAPQLRAAPRFLIHLATEVQPAEALRVGCGARTASEAGASKPLWIARKGPLAITTGPGAQ
jgi:flavin reductase (DIM6/NTAB) family NADH-FMN oxidoreductase RutF